MGARLIAALPAIAFALFIASRGGIIFTLALIGLGVICLHELYDMLADTDPVRLAGFLGLAGMLLAATYGTQYHVLLVATALVPLLFGLTMLQLRGGTLGMATTLFGVWWIGLGLAHAVLLRHLPHGGAIVIDVMVGTFLGDTGAYIGGRMFGQRPLAPRISPNKTVEGLLIGIITAVLAVWFAHLYEKPWLSGGHALLLGLGVALAAPLGDLFESFVKRDVGVKDTGRLFGAHGGALDRLDAILFSAVAGYFIWHAMV